MDLINLFLNSIECNDFNMARVLIAKGVNVRADNDFALTQASYFGNLDIVKVLVSMGADVRAWDDASLIWASRKGYLEIVKYLKSVYRKNNFKIPGGY